MSYDPDLDLLFFGSGNASTWYRALRGEGDSLYTACILAVKASTGELAWYFQTTPGDSFDYDATQPLLSADLTVGGRLRKVLLQANKNGFFYVLDRQTGEFLSAAPFVSGITWASGVDPKTGRPIELPGVGNANPKLLSPEPNGAHNWNPMAFHPATGLVYFPARVGTQMVHVPTRNGNMIRPATTSGLTARTKDSFSPKWSPCPRRPANFWPGIQPAAFLYRYPANRAWVRFVQTARSANGKHQNLAELSPTASQLTGHKKHSLSNTLKLQAQNQLQESGGSGGGD